jgi:alcohol dehydrogenase
MKALVYHGPGIRAWEDRPKPTIIEPTDAIVGVHGKPVEFHIEKLWSHNITLTTRLVDTVTTPMLLKIVQSGRLDAKKLVSHRVELSEIMKAYDTFGNAAKERALKVVLKNGSASGGGAAQ